MPVAKCWNQGGHCWWHVLCQRLGAVNIVLLCHLLVKNIDRHLLYVANQSEIEISINNYNFLAVNI